MDHRHRCVLLFLALLLLASAVSPARSDETRAEEDGHGASLSERAIGVTTAAFNTRWDAIRTRAKLAWMNLRQPSSSMSPGEVMKEAATKSFQTSKEVAEEAARSAVEVTEEAVGKAKEKVKSTTASMTRGDAADAEL